MHLSLSYFLTASRLSIIQTIGIKQCKITIHRSFVSKIAIHRSLSIMVTSKWCIKGLRFCPHLITYMPIPYFLNFHALIHQAFLSSRYLFLACEEIPTIRKIPDYEGYTKFDYNSITLRYLISYEPHL